ncbi:MAG TPA: sugar ABC transporter ATP-binding protein, partial [Bacteroidota bacterium]|nr:sugar ABC transporter ATP-binding protein [Bacteroidota bacterium]
LGGAEEPTSGSILVDGLRVSLGSPREALERGIATVHQELSLIGSLTVAENIFLGRLPRRHGLIDWGTARVRAAALLEELGLSIDVRLRAGDLGLAARQMIEIAKAMSHGPAVLMLDEPTSALSHRETGVLFALLKRLASQGVVILYITHRLEEIHRIADDVSVLRNGELVGTIPVSEARSGVIASMMFGETPARMSGTASPAPGPPVMTVAGFTRADAYSDISFTLHRGEILGVAGVLGAGRTELLRGLFGADPHDRGSVTIGGTTVVPSSPLQMKKLGVALAPEDRKAEGLVQILSTRININLAGYWPLSVHSLTGARRERVVAARYVREMDMAVPSLDDPVSGLSGGTQQKVVIAKWLHTQPRVLLLDEPTRGIDIRAKEQVFAIVRDLSARGIAALVVSSDLEELMDLCHRILVLRRGTMAGEILPGASSLEHLLGLCME